MLHALAFWQDNCVPRSSFSRTCSVLGLVAVLLTAPGSAFAQGDSERWGVNVSYTPTWDTAGGIRQLLEEEEGDEVNFKGSEFTIGVVRGRPNGGEWGVSFTYKKFKDEVAVTSVSTDCFPVNNQQVCLTETETITPQDAYVAGAEVHWFLAFVRIKDRVQIGANFAGGVGATKGNALRVTDGTDINFVPGPGGGTVVQVPFHEEEVVKFSDELFPIFPLFKAEAVASFLVAPSFRIKASYGINFPSYAFRLAGTYFF